MAQPPTPQWLTPEQERSWRALLMGHTLLMDQLGEELREDHDISIAEYEILVRLSEQPDHRMRMAHLADAMCHSRSRVTHTVKRMEGSGWLLRCDSPDDGRGVLAVMTDEGFALLQRASLDHVAAVRKHLIDLADPDDLAALGRVMDAVSDPLVRKRPAIEMRGVPAPAR